MAHIKCRYHNWVCSEDNICGRICKDHEYGYECRYFCDTYYDADKGMTAVTAKCIHAYRDPCTFEGDYRKYTFDGTRLVIGRKRIDYELIDYLEIDDHVYIEAYIEESEGARK